MPRVAVVIPVYNTSRYLSATVQSVCEQTIVDWELIIVDDGSTDESSAIARHWADTDRRIRTIRQDNQGLSAARNAGYAAMSLEAEYAVFVDADDVFEPDALETLLRTHAAHPDSWMVYGLARLIDQDGAPLELSDRDDLALRRFTFRGDRVVPEAWDRPTTFETLLFSNCIRTAGVVLLPSRTLSRVGLFDPEMGPNADWDFWLRVSLGGEIAFADKPVLAYRIHADNMSKARARMTDSRRALLLKLLAAHALTDRQRHLVGLTHKIQFGQSGLRLSEWHLAGVALRNALHTAGDSAQLVDSDVELNIPLLIALNGDHALAERVLDASSPLGTSEARDDQPETGFEKVTREPAQQPFNAGEILKIEQAYRYLERQDVGLQTWRAMSFLRRGKPGPACAHLGHAVRCIARLVAYRNGSK